MFDCEYHETVEDKNGNRKTVTVHSMKDSLFSIEERFNNAKREIDALQKENKRLRDEHYESEELQKMKHECDQIRDELDRGFEITEKEDEAISAWITEHCKNHHGGHSCYMDYIFETTELGIAGTVRCGSCGEEFCFREIQ